MKALLLLSLLSQQALAVSWNFSDRQGNPGTITIDESKVVPCPELPAERNGFISYQQNKIKFSACVDDDKLVGISSDEDGINFLMELHYVAQEFLIWSETREFENSSHPTGCEAGVEAGGIFVFKDDFNNPIPSAKYYCLK